jgi:hypothetical protein
MPNMLEVGQFLFDIFKDGARVAVQQGLVNVLPQGQSKQDLSGWQGPVSFPEQFQEDSILGFSLADFRIAANWEFNGQFIANFNVIADGTIDPLSSLDISVTAFQASFDGDVSQGGVAVMPYHIDLKFHNLTGGTELRTFRAKARGDGGGESSNI